VTLVCGIPRQEHAPREVMLLQPTAALGDLVHFAEGDAPATDPGVPRLLKEAEVLRPGTYVDMSGKRVTFTEADLQAYAASFNAQDPPPIQLDHSKSARDTQGYVRRLAVVDGRLMALAEFLGSYAVDNVRAGLWKKLSGGLYLEPRRAAVPVGGALQQATRLARKAAACRVARSNSPGLQVPRRRPRRSLQVRVFSASPETKSLPLWMFRWHEAHTRTTFEGTVSPPRQWKTMWWVCSHTVLGQSGQAHWKASRRKTQRRRASPGTRARTSCWEAGSQWGRRAGEAISSSGAPGTGVSRTAAASQGSAGARSSSSHGLGRGSPAAGEPLVQATEPPPVPEPTRGGGKSLTGARTRGNLHIWRWRWSSSERPRSCSHRPFTSISSG